MRVQLRWLVIIGVLVIAYGGWALGVRVPNNSLPLASSTNSRLAPNFTLVSTDGRTISMEDWQGRIRLLNFWATWCVPCRQEMPEIEAAYRAWQEQGFVVLSINEMDNNDAALEFARNLQLTFPVLLDSDETVAKSYRVTGLPTSIFIGRDGIVRTVKVGIMDHSYIETQLLAMGLSATSQQASSPVTSTLTGKSDSTPASRQSEFPVTPTTPVKSVSTPAGTPTQAQVSVAQTGRLDIDALYPPDEGRDLVLEYCASCHGLIPVAIVRRQPGGWAANRTMHEEQGLLKNLSAGQVDAMYRYLNKYRNRDVPRPKIPQELLTECDA